MKSIVIFNNKGGVGKTTLLCNLASYLKIEKKKKVIVIDTDPQCNATAYLFPYPQIELIYEKNGGTIYDVLKPLQKGRGYYTAQLPIIQSPNFKVDVIAGDPKLSLAEDFLSKDWLDGKSGDFRGLQTTLGFRHLNDRLGDYDYVIYDVGPSLGALNRAILIACDYFLVPMSSDIFSLRAIENISLSLTDWVDGISKGLKEYQKREKEAFTLDGSTIKIDLRFIGYVTQQYTAKTINGSKQPVKAYEKIIRKIPQSVSSELANFSSSNLSGANFKLGEIPNFHSLVPLSQSAAVPIFNLQAKDGVVGAHFNKVKEYEDVISRITNQLLRNISKSK